MFIVVRKDSIEGDGTQRVFDAKDKKEDAWAVADYLQGRVPGQFAVLEGKEVTRDD